MHCGLSAFTTKIKCTLLDIVSNPMHSTVLMPHLISLCNQAHEQGINWGGINYESPASATWEPPTSTVLSSGRDKIIAHKVEQGQQLYFVWDGCSDS